MSVGIAVHGAIRPAGALIGRDGCEAKEPRNWLFHATWVL